MNSTRRLIVIVGVVVVAAVGFVFAKALSGDSSTPAPPSTTALPAVVTTGGATSAAGSGTGTAAQPAARRAEAAIPQVVVRDLEPVGGVKQLVFRKGDMIRFTVASDQPEEVHLHGYDVADDVAPDRAATFVLPASIEGIFEVELERSGVQIASIAVEP
jgi:hypothetical protein